MSKRIIASVLASTGLLLMPFVVLAQPPGSLSIPLTTFVANVAILIFDILWIVAATYVTIMFVIAGFKFSTAQGNMEKVKEARNAVIYGLVGTIVVILAWSMVAVIRTQLGV